MKLKQGWARPYPNAAKKHFFKDGASLCGHWINQRSDAETEEKTLPFSSELCFSCHYNLSLKLDK